MKRGGRVVMVGLLLGGCARVTAEETTPEVSTVASSPAATATRPQMDGTCTMTANEQVITIIYAGGLPMRTTTTQPPLETQFSYEGERPIRIVSTGNGTVTSHTELEYDAYGRLAALIDVQDGARFVRRRFEYDAAGRLARIVELGNDGATRRVGTLTYDDRGRLVRTRWETVDYDDAEPRTTTYEYDTQGRVTQAITGDITMRTRFDAAGLEQRVEISQAERGVLYADTVIRDEQGRVRERRTNVGADVLTITQVVFDGTFGAGADCSGAIPLPSGFPDVPLLDWL